MYNDSDQYVDNILPFIQCIPCPSASILDSLFLKMRQGTLTNRNERHIYKFTLFYSTSPLSHTTTGDGFSKSIFIFWNLSEPRSPIIPKPKSVWAFLGGMPWTNHYTSLGWPTGSFVGPETTLGATRPASAAIRRPLLGHRWLYSHPSTPSISCRVVSSNYVSFREGMPLQMLIHVSWHETILTNVSLKSFLASFVAQNLMYL